MNISSSKLKKLIENAGLTDKKTLDKVSKEAQEKGEDFEEYIIRKKIVAEKNLREIQSSFLKIPFVDLTRKQIPKDTLFLIPEATAKEYKVIAYEQDEKNVKLAMTDPGDLQTIEFVRKKTGRSIISYLTTSDSIENALRQYRKNIRSQFDEIIQKNIEKAEKQGEKDPEKLALNLPVIRIVDSLIDYGINEEASDIHIEPVEQEINIRYRIDGILHNVLTLPKQIHDGVVARIKILSNLKLDEHRLPQDGRFKKEVRDQKYAFRVSVLPIMDGEKVVLRILKEGGVNLALEQLGFQHSALEKIKVAIKKPNGMILVTGPTGSGKTTTLYTILNALNIPGVNISTLEDPVEYRMSGVNQSQVKPKIGFSFANGLRSLLRQDPDIIMVGEIRDKETAELAIHAAMTGHLVLSTLHTNSAAGALPRLIDMGINPFLIASTVNVIIAQRLVRRICPNCIQSYNLTDAQVSDLEKQVDMDITLAAMVKEGIIAEEKEKQGLKKMNFYKGAGCEQCGGEGYKGRIGVFEALEITDAISDLVMKKAPDEEIENKAIEEQGMIIMIQDGFIKARTGITSIEEVLRVTKE